MLKRQRIEDVPTYDTKRFKTTTVCTHPGFHNELCLRCGLNADEDSALLPSYTSSVPLDYKIKGLRLSKYHIALVKFINTKNLLAQRKLYLVLDLDHTLLHSIQLLGKDPDEVQSLIEQADNSLRGELVHLSLIDMVTKVRPYVRTFLEKANNMFKMYIYTRAERRYADTIARLLDPKGVYFGSRVIAREDCTRPPTKRLDVVLGQERAILILDDQEKVWPDHKENLICVEKYNYFSPEKCGDDNDQTLELVLDSLKKIHTEFFREYEREKFMETDARKALKMVRDGCKT